MVAEIISIGTEILLGNIVNTNASFLALISEFHVIISRLSEIMPTD
jgi:molybdopterin-biosynthesis enzyme MoeA-like protein